ncbi:transducin family protein [Hibiscus syriacus]|uniref:Transducin family protein n=1 Tax=Hibiscus syriacus TaxID=106335 RepID=A0A6A3B1M0_HIBSY|nr:transducin family protein [Hibiscus syriacus]
MKVAGDILAQLSKGGTVLMVCRTCGKKGDHWTSKCPYKDLAAPVETFVDKPAASETSVAASGSSKGAYVPPSMRAGAERTAGSDMRRRNDENSVRVTNLSEDTREPNLLELFRPFGAVTRVYVAMGQKTGASRGFGFVNFVNRGCSKSRQWLRLRQPHPASRMGHASIQLEFMALAFFFWALSTIPVSKIFHFY